MNRIQDILKFAELIAKYISNHLNSEERERLESWMNESKDNKKLIGKIKNWNNFQERNSAYKSYNTKHAWQQFSLKIEKPDPRIRIISLFKYAATIVLPLLLGGLIFYLLSENRNDITQQTASIDPGTQNAIIVLDDGQTINLEDAQLDLLVEEDGTEIQNKKGELSYTEVKAKKLKKPLKNTLIVPRGGEYKLALSDGSRVFLNSVSKLTYPVVFDDERREVYLEGEAYFEIEKDVNKPFLVNINGLKIEVLGTSFNVKAYTDEDEIYTTLVEGKIKLNTDKNESEWILTPDQQAVLEKSSDDIIVRKVDVQQYIAWKNGIYSFTNQSLGDIMKTLSRWYDFEYEFANEDLKEISFEGGLNKYEDITPILEIMQSTGKVNYEINGSKITFMSE